MVAGTLQTIVSNEITAAEPTPRPKVVPIAARGTESASEVGAKHSHNPSISKSITPQRIPVE